MTKTLKRKRERTAATTGEVNCYVILYIQASNFSER